GGVFNVSVFENSAVKVINSLGSVVYSANVEANTTVSVNLNAASGVYFVSVVGTANATTEKLIVK
ncbi:MAG: T9SS type A sorting domain-containing protein, partial [Paludibacteraceae bacterium]|nr:T9SS type A sorting domain-containing protein [Paludibacteraceae bacterium]